MNIAAIGQLNLHLHPALKHLQEVFKKNLKIFLQRLHLVKLLQRLLAKTFLDMHIKYL
jgi:hypothetical protein